MSGPFHSRQAEFEDAKELALRLVAVRREERLLQHRP
jgi:hypothetical protein